MKGNGWNFVGVLVLIDWLLVLASGEDSDVRRAIKVIAKSEKELVFLHHLEDVQADLDIVIERKPRRLNASYIFTAVDSKQPQILEIMREHDICDYEVFSTKSDQMIEQPVIRRRSNLVENMNDPEIVTKKYLSYEEGNNYIEFMANKINQTNSKVSATVMIEGQTYENRQISSITIAYQGKSSNPVIFIDAGIHAREWHARSMALYLLAKLADEAALDQSGMIFNATFIIVPSVNPDGYAYSFAGKKLWRKTRKPVGNCFGVDGNRNFDANWDTGTMEKLPCNEVYRGPKPFSEEETIAVKNIMLRVKDQCKLYISIHTFGNSILFPWGYTHEQHPRQEELLKVGQAGVDAVLKETGSVFDTHSSSNLYTSAGGSDDYAIDSVGIPFAYTLELGAEELNFAVPLTYLKQTLDNGWIVIKAMTLEVLKML